MFRGGRGATPNNSRRPGDAQGKDYRGSNQNKQYGGKDASPSTQTKDLKSEQATPAKEPSNTPGKTTTSKLDERNGPRKRSRSPIDRKGQSASTNNVDGQSSTEEKKEEKAFKYTGRPGEKKFSGRCRLFVANIHNTTEEELKKIFNEFGETGEAYVNKEKGFGFIRLDYRHNAEMAKLSLDNKRVIKNRTIKVQYATHASAIELHGLDNYASNEFIERAMSTFGTIERCVVVCDDRGRSKGYAIVEFEWKKSAAKVLDRLKDEMFVLGRLPKPVFAKPFILCDKEEGVQEEALERLDGLEAERACEPRFISPNSSEYIWAKRWRDLFIEEQDKKARLEQEMSDARCKLEFETEAAIRQQEASKIREELARRQEELRMLSEDMMMRQEADMRILERSRQRELAAQAGQSEPPPRNEQEVRQNEIQLSRENAARQQDFVNLRQRAEMTLQDDRFGNMDGRGPPRPQPGGFGQQRGGPQQGYSGGYGPPGGQQGGPRSQQPGMDYRNQQRGPPREMQQREMQQREMHQREMQQREMQQREMQHRGMEGRDKPPPREMPPARDLPARDLVREAPPKDNPTEEKKQVHQ